MFQMTERLCGLRRVFSPRNFSIPSLSLRPLRALQGVSLGLVKQADVQQGPWLRWRMVKPEAVGVREWCAFTYMEHKTDRTCSVGVSFAV
jgi:hypothetical protein